MDYASLTLIFQQGRAVTVVSYLFEIQNATRPLRFPSQVLRVFSSPLGIKYTQ
jgi:hypothetical protein